MFKYVNIEIQIFPGMFDKIAITLLPKYDEILFH